jgi:tripartite-type tricarboxylate transporter receptor subunit TctC
MMGQKIAATNAVRGEANGAMRTNAAVVLTFAALGAATLPPGSVRAQSVSEFYKDRTVAMVIGGSPGGGFDTLARGIARHIGKHIPGHPVVVPRNMAGAGGLLAMDHLYNIAARDGSVIALVGNTTPFVPLVSGKPARFDPLKMNWLGTPSVESPMVLVWHTVPVKTVEDLKTRETTMGASGADSPQAFFGRLINTTLGTKMKIITGYQGQNEIFIAMERGEVDGFPSAPYSSITSTRPNWLRDGSARAVLQYGPERLKELPDVPWAPELITNEDDKELMKVANAPNAMGRPLVMPPGVPADRLAAIRKALADTFKDPDFIEEANKIGLLVNAPRTGEQLYDVLRDAYASVPATIERLRKLER